MNREACQHSFSLEFSLDDSGAFPKTLMQGKGGGNFLMRCRCWTPKNVVVVDRASNNEPNSEMYLTLIFLQKGVTEVYLYILL